jgi:hypothetical protein
MGVEAVESLDHAPIGAVRRGVLLRLLGRPDPEGDDEVVLVLHRQLFLPLWKSGFLWRISLVSMDMAAMHGGVVVGHDAAVDEVVLAGGGFPVVVGREEVHAPGGRSAPRRC